MNGIIVCCEYVRRLTSKSVYSERSERNNENNENGEGEGAEIWSQDDTNSDQIQEAETSCHHVSQSILKGAKHGF